MAESWKNWTWQNLISTWCEVSPVPESASEEEIIFGQEDPKVEVDHGGCPTMTEEVVEVSSIVSPNTLSTVTYPAASAAASRRARSG